MTSRQENIGVVVGRAVAAEVQAHAGVQGPRKFELPEHLSGDREAMLRSIWTDMASSGPLWSNIRVIHEGRDLHVSRFMDATLGEGLVLQSYVDSRAIARYIADGATLVYNHLHETSYPVQQLQETLEYELGTRVWIQIYVTRADRTAFGLHCDNHNFVILQLSGPKSWQVVGLTADNDELTLTPGDGLFLRAQTMHAVSGLGELAVHMTIAFDWLQPTEEQSGSTMSADDYTKHCKKFRVGSFLPIAVAPELVDVGLSFRSASRVRPTISNEGDKVVVRCAAGSFGSPAGLRPLLDLVLDGRPITIDGMVEQTGLGRGTVKSFVTFAVKNGIMVCG